MKQPRRRPVPPHLIVAARRLPRSAQIGEPHRFVQAPTLASLATARCQRLHAQGRRLDPRTRPARDHGGRRAANAMPLRRGAATAVALVKRKGQRHFRRFEIVVQEHAGFRRRHKQQPRSPSAAAATRRWRGPASRDRSRSAGFGRRPHRRARRPAENPAARMLPC